MAFLQYGFIVQYPRVFGCGSLGKPAAGDKQDLKEFKRVDSITNIKNIGKPEQFYKLKVWPSHHFDDDVSNNVTQH